MPNMIRKAGMRPRPATWIRHLTLLFLTFLTCTIAGVLMPFGFVDLGPQTDPQSWSDAISLIPSIPYSYLQLIFKAVGILASDMAALEYGLSFSISLLFILIAHEMGHYITCRLYGVDATLPYFIPAPPLIGPAGTLGAFIRIVSPMPSRKAVFDIGVAGPIAGFIALLPVAILMIFTLESAEPIALNPGEMQIVFADPLLIRLLAWAGGIDLSLPIYPNPFYFATWVGLLVTALNLIPSGQLDGGHALYAVFGERVHLWTGRTAFVVMAIFSVVGIFYFNSPAGILFAIVLAFMMRVRHPVPDDEAPLDGKRIAVAILTLLIFLLCFVPFPIRLI